MRLEFYQVDRLKKEVLSIIGKYFGHNDYKVFFFGSRVRGNNFERADIDVGIEGRNPVPVEIKLKIEEELERIPTLYKFDFVDFKKVANAFKKEALQHIEYVHC